MRATPTLAIKGTVTVHDYSVAFRNISAIATNALDTNGGYIILTTAASTIGNSGNIREAGVSGNGIFAESEM